MKTSSRFFVGFGDRLVSVITKVSRPGLATVLLVSVLMGCAPRLDINPSLDIPDAQSVKNVDDLNQVLTSAYASIASKYFLGASLKVWPDVISDQIVINPASPYALKETDIANRRFNASDSLIILAWEQGYRAVNLSNQVIDKVQNGGLSGEAFTRNRDRILGEAYFIRAVALFELVRFFAPAYTSSTANQLAIPMPLSPSTVRENPPIPTLDQLYQQVKQDLSTAATLLPFRYSTTTAKSGSFSVFGNATGAAAKAYLAKVCFQQGGSNEQQALQAINETIGTVDSLVDGQYYPENFPMVGSNTRDIGPGAAYSNYGVVGRGSYAAFATPNNEFPEVIFNIMNRGDQDFSREIFYRYTYDLTLAGTNPRYLLSDTFRLRNFTLSTDARFAYYTGGVTKYNGNRFCIQKWFNSSPTFNVIVIRSAELVLSRARIHFNLAQQTTDPTLRQQYLTKALHDMFYVKKKSRRLTTGAARPLDNLNYCYTNARIPNNNAFETLLDQELNRERQRELFGEGDRLHDIRRQGLTVISGNGQRGSENIPDYNLPLEKSILPIPISETAINASLNR